MDGDDCGKNLTRRARVRGDLIGVTIAVLTAGEIINICLGARLSMADQIGSLAVVILLALPRRRGPLMTLVVSPWWARVRRASGARKAGRQP